jgi:SHS2 domain-containing protein
MGTYEEIPHTADYALQVRGADLPDLMEAAGAGFLALVNTPERPGPARLIEFEITAEDPAVLVLRAVRELLYYLEAGELPVTFEVMEATEDPPAARLRVGLVPLAGAAHYSGRAPKAVTYHDLRLGRDERGLYLTLTFDT